MNTKAITVVSLQARSIKKVFDRKVVFQNLSLELTSGESIAITGENGSGKSTLVKILASLVSPNLGEIRYKIGTEIITKESLLFHVGFVAPYLNFYEELTGFENVQFAIQSKSKLIEKSELEFLFDYFRLKAALHKSVKKYSSGMIQRLKFIQAFAQKPSFLFLDEPTSTLDENGRHLFWQMLNSITESCIIIIASNDKAEIEFCQKKISMEDFKPQQKSLV